MTRHRVTLITIWGVVLITFLFKPSVSQAHCACAGIVGRLHCEVEHFGRCEEEEKGSPRDELDEPEPKVMAVSILGSDGEKIDTVEVGEEFLVEVEFDREPENSALTVAVTSLTPDGATRHSVNVSARKTSQGRVFRSSFLQVAEPEE